MPIPKANKGEDRTKFMGRCMSAMNSEYPDQKQRAAICFRAFRTADNEKGNDMDVNDLAVQTKTLKQKLILKEGEWNGTFYPAGTVREAFNDLKEFEKLPSDMRDTMLEPEEKQKDIMYADHNDGVQSVLGDASNFTWDEESNGIRGDLHFVDKDMADKLEYFESVGKSFGGISPRLMNISRDGEAKKSRVVNISFVSTPAQGNNTMLSKDLEGEGNVLVTNEKPFNLNNIFTKEEDEMTSEEVKILVAEAIANLSADKGDKGTAMDEAIAAVKAEAKAAVDAALVEANAKVEADASAEADANADADGNAAEGTGDVQLSKEDLEKDERFVDLQKKVQAEGEKVAELKKQVVTGKLAETEVILKAAKESGKISAENDVEDAFRKLMNVETEAVANLSKDDAIVEEKVNVADLAKTILNSIVENSVVPMTESETANLTKIEKPGDGELTDEKATDLAKTFPKPHSQRTEE